MLIYDQYEDASGCTHRIAPDDMSHGEPEETRTAALDAVTSLYDYAQHMRREVARRQTLATDTQAILEVIQQHLRVAQDFIRWVVQISEAGPRVELDHLKRRAERALLGHERHESHPPRPM